MGAKRMIYMNTDTLNVFKFDLNYTINVKNLDYLV